MNIRSLFTAQSFSLFVAKITNYITLVLVIVTIFSVVRIISDFRDSSSAQAWELKEDIVYIKRAYISGAIEKPGVYEINETTTIIDLINSAGGFTKDYDDYSVAKSINLAERVFNEDHIFIPPKTEQQAQSLNISSADSKLNINTASLQQLVDLPGIGETTADKIIKGRPFSTIEDVGEVEGIGDATFAKFKDLIIAE